MLHTKSELLRYVGDLSQLTGIRESTLTSGRARGLRALDADNGAGLHMTVLPDRGMEIAALQYKGFNLGFLSKAGITAPTWFEPAGNEPLRSFSAGFLTTCGMRQSGDPCRDAGEELFLHGRLPAAPAEQVCAETLFDGEGAPYLRLSGQLRESKLMGENLLLRREIICPYGEPCFTVADVAENRGFSPEPLMLLYHFNFGYPLLSEAAYAVLPVEATEYLTPPAREEPEAYTSFQAPAPGYAERTYLHRMQALPDGSTFALFVNSSLSLGVALEYSVRALPYLMQWKMMAAGDYVCAFEPATSRPEGRRIARERGQLTQLLPQQSQEIRLSLRILDGGAEIRTYLGAKRTAGFTFSAPPLT